MKDLGSAFKVAAFAAACIAPAAFAQAAQAGTQLTFAPAADAYIDATRPGTNFGRTNALKLGAGKRAYLRFDVRGLGGAVTRAELLFWTTSPSSTGFRIHPVGSDTWKERRLTWRNAPSMSPARGASGGFPAGTWKRVDVTALIAGDGLASFALVGTKRKLFSLASRESSKDPQLVVRFNRAPGCQSQNMATSEDTPVTGKVACTDPDGDALTYGLVRGTGRGTLGFNASGGFTYAPDADLNGTDSFVFQASDGAANAQATVVFSVAPVNDVPVCDEADFATDEDEELFSAVTCTDADGDQLLYELEVGADSGEVFVEEDGSFSYLPDPDFNGSDLFTFIARDGRAQSPSATATIVVAAVPGAADDAATTPEEVSVVVNVLANDSPGPADESGQGLTVTRVTLAPAAGTAEILLTGDDAGKIRYTPDPDAFGVDELEYEVCDGGSPQECAYAFLEVTVTNVNDEPVCDDHEFAVDEGEELLDAVVCDDADGDDLTYVLESPADSGDVVLEPDGSFAYTPPDPDFSGPDGFTFSASDNEATSGIATASIDVLQINDPVTAGDDSATTVEDTPVVIDVGDNDSPGALEDDQELTFTVTSAPAHGSAGGASGRTIAYSPDSNYFGPDSFEYEACDDGFPQECASATVDVTVSEVNDPPVAGDDEAHVAEDGTVIIEATQNDSPGAANEDGQALTLAVETFALEGAAEVPDTGPDAGKLRYRPFPGFTGGDSFTYSLCDDGTTDGAPDPQCDTATVTMSVNRVAPTVETPAVPHSGDAADDIAIWVNPSDPSQSVVIGTNKHKRNTADPADTWGGLMVYDLAGAELQALQDGAMNNVDLRSAFPLGGGPVTLVAATDRGAGQKRIALYRLDPATRTLVLLRGIPLPYEPSGLCLYRSPTTSKFYAFVTKDNSGQIEQWELVPDATAEAGIRGDKMPRVFNVLTEAEGCVADDELAHFYVAQEDVGIWKYGAEPTDGATRTQVDATGAAGHLTADVEGLSIAYGPNGTGFLFASSQGNDAYTVYEREGANAYIRTFSVLENTVDGIDGTTVTDGIDVTASALGPTLPNGVFIAQDNTNPTAVGNRQNFKFVPLEQILGNDLSGSAGTGVTASCSRPYADTSPWNTAIGASPAYDENSATFVSSLDGSGLLTSDPTQYTFPVYEVSAGTPLEEVWVSGWYSNVYGDGTQLQNQRAGVVRLPIPAGAEPADGSDAQLVLVNESTGDEWGVSRLERDPDGRLVAWNAYHYHTTWSGVPPYDASPRPFFARGAGVPYLAGLVRPCEIEQGSIDHALAFAYDFPTDQFVYPATKSDGNSVDYVHDVPEGTRLQLDSALTDAQIATWGCTGACLTIAHALQEYGMYVIDNSGRPKVMLEYEGTANWAGTVTDATVSTIPLSAFKVLDLP